MAESATDPAPNTATDASASSTTAKATAPTRPLVIAHRGASVSHAEHTLAAYETALAEGADGFECDVRLTADGVMVCLHDRRIDRTSDGHAVVSSTTYAELVKYDYGSWHELAGPQTQSEHLVGDSLIDSLGDEGIPGAPPTREPAVDPSAANRLLTMRQLLEFAKQAPRPVSLSIETKHPVRFGGLIERRLARILGDYGLTDPNSADVTVRVMSFSSVALRRMHQLAPKVPTVFLMDRVPVMHRDGSLPKGVRIAGPGIHILRDHPHYVERVHRQGNQVHVWTVDSPADVKLCLEQGVDAIITNQPGDVLKQITAYAGE